MVLFQSFAVKSQKNATEASAWRRNARLANACGDLTLQIGCPASQIARKPHQLGRCKLLIEIGAPRAFRANRIRYGIKYREMK
jgi:hypothetical protein